MPNKIIDTATLRAKTNAVVTLPTMPSTLRQISGLLEKPRISLDEIGRFISNDPALTTKVLRMVNSAAYGFPGRISSVSHAIMLLGLNVIKGLLLGISVFEIMQKTMSGLWEHSLACAVASRTLAQKKQMKEPEEVSVCGLLHDIGKVILVLQYAEEYRQAMGIAEKEEIAIGEAELKFFEVGHADVGLWLAKKWQFPPNLADAIGYHHHPAMAKGSPLETAIVHVADVLVRARGVGFAGDGFVPAVFPAAWEMLNLSEDDVMDVLAQLEGLAGASAAEEMT